VLIDRLTKAHATTDEVRAAVRELIRNQDPTKE